MEASCLNTLDLHLYSRKEKKNAVFCYLSFMPEVLFSVWNMKISENGLTAVEISLIQCIQGHWWLSH